MRRRLCILSEVFKFKDKQFSGQGNKINTRAHNLYTRFHRKIDLMAARYCRARGALGHLDPQGSWRTTLLPLVDTDVRPMRSNDDDKPGEGTFVLTWIWRRAPSGDMDVLHNSVRVEWAKLRARVARWDEEGTLLMEEMRRVVSFLRWKARWWSSVASSRATGDVRVRDGATAYALKQSDNFSYLSESFICWWGLVLDKHHINRPWPKEIEPTSTPSPRIGSLTQIFPPRKASQRKRGRRRTTTEGTDQGARVGNEVVCDRASRSFVLRVFSKDEYTRRGLQIPGLNRPAPASLRSAPDDSDADSLSDEDVNSDSDDSD